jgi:hypothetical protein
MMTFDRLFVCCLIALGFWEFSGLAVGMFKLPDMIIGFSIAFGFMLPLLMPRVFFST